ncbi:MAG TPA: hypothetical protein ENI56_01115 [Candidatus Kaiserbacteria bacterium]|nr:hypothetical protein [Candidatus Kaiserbacteria bacterium]
MQSQVPVEITSQTTEPFQNPTDFPPHKKHHIVKILSWVFGIIIGVPIVFIIIINILGLVYHDSAPKTYPSLEIKAVSVPRAQNAYFDMLNTATQVRIVLSATSTPAQKSVAKTALYSAFVRAAQKHVYQDPVAANPNSVSVNSLLPPLNDFRRATILNDAYAIQLAKNGKTSQALTQALATVFVGNKMTASQGDIIEYLVGSKIEKDGLNTLRAIATSTTFSNAKILIKTASALNGKSDDGSGLAKVFKLEWHIQKSVIQSIHTAYMKYLINNIYVTDGTVSTTTAEFFNVALALKPSFYWHPNETVVYAAKAMQRHLKLSVTSCTLVGKHDTALTQPASGIPANHLLWYFTPNIIGKIQLSILRQSFFLKLKLSQCDGQALLRATQLTLALRAYQIDHHALPSSLSELVPNYLYALPLDPYNGKAFHYSSSRGVIYSVGYDGKNSLSSGGSDAGATFIVK